MGVHTHWFQVNQGVFLYIFKCCITSRHSSESGSTEVAVSNE